MGGGTSREAGGPDTPLVREFERRRNALSFFAPGLLALLVRGGQSHPDQHPNGVGAGWMAGLPAAPFINLLSPLRLKSKTDDWDLPTPRAPALFSCYVIRLCHTPYYEKISFGESLRRLGWPALFCITWFCTPSEAGSSRIT